MTVDKNNLEHDILLVHLHGNFSEEHGFEIQKIQLSFQ